LVVVGLFFGVDGDEAAGLQPVAGGGAPGGGGIMAVGVVDFAEDGSGAVFDPDKCVVALASCEAGGRQAVVGLRGGGAAQRAAPGAVAEVGGGVDEGSDGGGLP
jgi:hypothetical protein